MNDSDLLTAELGNLALAVIDPDAVVNTEHMNAASFCEENFFTGWICRICLVVHSNTVDSRVVLACKDKDSWSLVVLHPLWHREAQRHCWILRAACWLWKADLLPDLVG